MSIDEPYIPNALPQAIVDWQPSHGPDRDAGLPVSGAVIGAVAAGVLTVGIVMLGAMVLQALARGRLDLGKAR